MCDSPSRLGLALARLDPSLRSLVMQACTDHPKMCAEDLQRFLCRGTTRLCFAIGYSADMLDACLASAMGSSRAELGPWIADSTPIVLAGVVTIVLFVFWYTTCAPTVTR